MRHLIALFLLVSSLHASAQKHRAFADVGLPLGFSATYNYTLTKYFAIGAGVQGYEFSPAWNEVKMFTPGFFADLRINIRPGKNNQFFSFADIGMNIYKLKENYPRDSITVHYVPNNGFYTGLGFAYLRRVSKRGSGPYASLKLMTNWHTVYRYSIISVEDEYGTLAGGFTLAASVGFKL